MTYARSAQAAIYPIQLLFAVNQRIEGMVGRSGRASTMTVAEVMANPREATRSNTQQGNMPKEGDL